MTPDEIKALRMRLGLTTMALAIRLGVSVDSIRAYEQGKREPSDKILARLLELDFDTRLVAV
jgi:DNA-binding transcriptional regulator YiaG